MSTLATPRPAAQVISELYDLSGLTLREIEERTKGARQRRCQRHRREVVLVSVRQDNAAGRAARRHRESSARGSPSAFAPDCARARPRVERVEVFGIVLWPGSVPWRRVLVSPSRRPVAVEKIKLRIAGFEGEAPIVKGQRQNAGPTTRNSATTLIRGSGGLQITSSRRRVQARKERDDDDAHMGI